MKIKDLLVEAESNPGTAFSQGFDQGADAIKGLFKGRMPNTSKGAETKKTLGNLSLNFSKFELNDIKEIFSAVIENKVDQLDNRQKVLARKLLEKLNNL